MISRGSKRVLTPLVTGSVILVLVFAGIMGLVEKGPPNPALPGGASPLNPGNLGISDFFNALKNKYPLTKAVTSLADLDFGGSDGRCVYIVISPETAFTLEDSIAVFKKLLECSEPALLVASEYDTGLSTLARPSGAIYGRVEDGLPYITAVFTLKAKTVNLTLDIASSIVVSEPSFIPYDIRPVPGGRSETFIIVTLEVEITESKVLGYANNIIDLNTGGRYERVDVATLTLAKIKLPDGRVRSYREIVVSDGSIFLNQVLRSKEGGKYFEVVMSLVDELCGGERDCRIIVDSSKYPVIDSETLLSRSDLTLNIFMQDWYFSAALLIPKLLHPSTWFIPALSITGDWLEVAMRDQVTGTLIVLATFLLLYLFFESKMPSVKDERLSEVLEKEEYATSTIREAVVKGKYSFTRQDFIRLYEIVNAYFRELVGVSMESREALTLLARYVGREEAEEYLNSMNRLRDKALGRRRLPLIISWHRLVEKKIRESEKILNKLGASMADEKGFEYLEMRRV
jgi:hypothetical protein